MRLYLMTAMTVAMLACGSPSAPTAPAWPVFAPVTQAPLDLVADGPAHITACGPTACGYIVTIRNRGNACIQRVSGRLTVLAPDGSELAFHEWGLPATQRLGPFALVTISAAEALPRAVLGGSHYRMGFAWEYFSCAVIS